MKSEKMPAIVPREVLPSIAHGWSDPTQCEVPELFIRDLPALSQR